MKSPFVRLEAGALGLILLLGLCRQASGEIKPPDLHHAEAAEVLAAVQAQFPQVSEFQKPGLSLETLNAKLAQLGALVSPEPLERKNVETVKTELLQRSIAYWRVPSFRAAKSGPPLERLLASSLQAEVQGLVIDLRDFQTPNDFAGGVAIAANLVPVGTVIYSVQALQAPQQVFTVNEQALLFRKPVVVLTNPETIGAGEALAAGLKRSAKAIIMGRSTAGAGGVYREIALPTRRFLRLPLAHSALPDGTKLLGAPVQPDLALFTTPEAEAEALAQIRLMGAEPGLRERSSKRRMTEAALVREEDPEIDNALNTRLNKGEEAPVVVDAALVRAVDLIRAIALSYPAR